MSIIQKSNYSSKNNIFIMREDLIPNYFGGNKVRIAQEYFEDMKRKECNCIVAYGNSRSNLCRVIAQMCATNNIPCYVISPSDENGERVETNNSIIVNLMGAEIINCKKNEVSDVVENTLSVLRDKGLLPYYIYGDKFGKGNEKVAVEAYVKVYKDILQYQEGKNRWFDYIFLASGTGTTQSGLICGKHIYGGVSKIVGISIARKKEVGYKIIKKNILDYIGHEISDEIYFTDDYVLGGYGNFNDEVIKIIQEIIKKDSIGLDTTYVGKAFYGMVKYLDKNNIQDKNILFIHTGSLPLFFDKIKVIGVENGR